MGKLLDGCSNLLLKLRNADLANFSQSFKSRLPELYRAKTKWQDGVHDLEGGLAIIDTVSAAMGTVAGIVKLLA